MTKILLIIPFLVLIYGCSSNSNAQSTSPEIEFQELARDFYTHGGIYTNKQAKIINDQVSYNDELAIYTSETPAIVDFNRGKVLLADMGQRISGGYSIEVTSVSEEENYVIASIELVYPGQFCLTTDALTNPYQFVFIPTDKEILVTEFLVVDDCAE